MIYEIGRWEVLKENSEEHLKAIKASIAFQKENRNRFFYTNTRFLIMDSTNADQETWMFIDEYPDVETYNKWLEEVEFIEIEMAEILEFWGTTIIIESFKTEVFLDLDLIKLE